MPLPLPLLNAPKTKLWWWVFLIIGVVFIVVAMMIGMIAGLVTGADIESENPADMFNAANVLVTCALCFAGYYILRRFIEQSDTYDLSLRGGAFGGAGRELSVGIAIAVAMLSAVVAIMAAFGAFKITGMTSLAVVMPAFYMATYAAITEEILMRGLLFRLSEHWMGSWLALILSAFLFGLMHIFNDNSGWLPSIAIAIEAGLLLGAAYMLTRRLWVVIGIHFGWNFVLGGIYGIPVSGYAFPSVFQSEIGGADLITGGKFGAEASIITIIIGGLLSAYLIKLCIDKGHLIAPKWKRKPPAADAGALK